MNNFQGLRAQLEKQDWPSVYFFKFILPNENEKITQLSALFENSELKLQPSRNGKFISISSKEVMLNAEKVIEIYEKASLIKGIISL
jgi:hypothetical protein